MSGAARAPAGSGSGPAHTTLAISQVHKESWFRSFHPQWQTHAAAYELLFRPRQWVREAVRCRLNEELAVAPRAELTTACVARNL